MKNRYLWLLTIALNLGAIKATAQTNQPPAAATGTFAKMFPGATKVEWKEKTNDFTVFFNLSDRKCEAKFAKTGGWLSTEETIAWDSLPALVLDGFKTGQYADWVKTSAYSIQPAEGSTQYHLVVSRNDMGRKILFFSPDGHLLVDH